ncbi:hypothetical protein HMPREF0491_03091, partial [Lachnospiraceae oral taxon 107 str. F0167]
MECKVEKLSSFLLAKKIGIYPEWNVKKVTKKELDKLTAIGIYPEWNVKFFNPTKIGSDNGIGYI